MELKKVLDLAYKYREESLACFSEEKSKSLLDDAIKLLTAELVRNSGSSEVLCALGLCWYDYPEESKIRYEKVSSYLNKSLEIDCDNKMSLLYLGYYYFDAANYKDSLAMLKRFDHLVSSEEKNLWFCVKLKELIFCCHVYLGYCDDEVFDLFQSVLVGYESSNVDDLPIPKEMVACLSVAECFSMSDKDNRRFLAVLKNLDVYDIFKEQVVKIIKKPCHY